MEDLMLGMKQTTLSFLTESKASHVGLISMRRVAMTLLLMLLTAVSVWAQEVGGTFNISTNLIPGNGGTINAPEQEVVVGTVPWVSTLGISYSP